MLPVGLHQHDSAAGLERTLCRGEDEPRALAVVERVVDEACVETAAQVELLVVAGLEDDVEPLAGGLLAGDRDHLR